MSETQQSTASSDTSVAGKNPATPIKVALIASAVIAVGLLAFNLLPFLR